MKDTSAPFHPDRVLVLDDVQLMRSALINVLRKLQFNDIKDTQSVEQAKFWLQNWHYDPQIISTPTTTLSNEAEQWNGPDLIFLDINLTGNAKKEQQSGLEVLKEIRAMPKGDQPFIVIASAEDPQAIAAKAFELGANSYLTKPFNGNNIVQVMKQYSAHRQTRQEESK